MQSHLALQIAFALPVRTLQLAYQYLVMLSEQAAVQGTPLRVTAARMRNGTSGSPPLAMSTSSIRRALIALENLNLIERQKDPDPRWGQTIRLVDHDHDETEAVITGLTALKQSELGRTLWHELRISQASFHFWENASHVLSEEGVNAESFFSLGFQPHETLFGPSHELLEEARSPAPQGTHSVPQGTACVPRGTGERGCLDGESRSTYSDPGTAVAVPEEGMSQMQSSKWNKKTKERRSIERKTADAMERVRKSMETGEPLDVTQRSKTGRLEKEKVALGVDPSKRARKKKGRAIRLNESEWPSWSKIQPLVEQLLPEHVFPRPLFPTADDGGVIVEQCDPIAWRLLGLLKDGIRRKGFKWNPPAGTDKGGYAQVCLDTLLRFNRLQLMKFHRGNIDDLEWLIRRTSPRASGHIPLEAIPDVLAGWAFKAVRAIKQGRFEYVSTSVDWRDVFNPHRWLTYRAVWLKAKREGIVDDPWEWIDSLPKNGCLMTFDPADLPEVEAKKQEEKFQLDINEILKGL